VSFVHFAGTPAVCHPPAELQKYRLRAGCKAEQHVSSQFPLNVAVVGTGAFGRNHARVYRQLQQAGSVRLVGVVDPDTARADAVAREFGCKSFGSIEQMLTTHSEVQAASVAVPTVKHLAVARILMEAGVDLLIEKPLASTIAEAAEIASLSEKHNRIVQVGQLERFNPAVRATLPLVTKPMFFEVHRLSVFTPRSLDVDVVLDLMIHDIDVVLSFAQSPVKEVRAVGLPVVSGKVDIANVRMEFESGCVANLTASRISTEKVRKLRFFQPREYISVDYARQDVLQFRVSSEERFSLDELLASIGAPDSSPIPGVTIHRPKVQQEEPLHAELKSFVDAVRRRSRPVVTLEDGRRALALALEILAAIAEHSRKAGLGA
jgi:predicted dehydrogenase